ncbi:MAG: VOC family protein [Caldilineaceae bacterium]|nr:VOC family protein [Caldilineaceae bacterium]
MAHPIVHVEFSAKDQAEAAKWYSELFGWQTQSWPEMSYTTFLPEEGAVGGGFNPIGNGTPAGAVVVYIETDDIAGHVAKIEQAGGVITMPIQQVPTVGQIAVFRDPSGNMVGLIQPEMNR